MAADSTTLQLQQALPQLGPLAIPIVGAIVAVGAVVATRDLLDRFFRQKGETQKTTYLTIEKSLTSAINDPKALPGLQEDGWSTSFLTGQVAEAVAAQIKILDTPTYLPSFATQQAAVDFWGENYNYYLQGFQTDNYFTAITAWVNAESLRLAITPPVPGVTPLPGPVTVITPKFQVGQIVQTSDGVLWLIKDIATLDTQPFYTTVRSDTGSELKVPESILLAAGAIVYSAPAAGIGASAATVVIPGFGTAQVSVTVQGVVVTGVTPSVPVTQPTQQTIVVPAPNVTVEPTTVNVEASPAPSVWVTPQLSTGALESALAVLPMTLSQTLVGALAASAGGIQHAANMGRNACFGSTGAALLGQLGMPLAALSLPIMFSKVPVFRKAEEGAFTWLLDQWLDPIRARGGITPAEGPGVAVAMLNATVAMGMSAHLAAIAGEAVTPLKYMGINYLAGFLAELAGWSRIASGTVGTIESISISQPLKYYVNSLTRSALPDVGRALSLYAQRELEWDGDEQEPGAHQILGYHGLSEAWADIYQDEAYRHPTIRELLRNVSYLRLDMVPGFESPPSDVAAYLTAAGYPPKPAYPIVWPYHLAILKSGYHPAYVPWLTDLTQRAAARGEKTAMIGTAQKMRRDGFISSARMTELVLDAWQLTDPVSARVEVAELEADYKVLGDTRAVIVLSMAKGLITRDEARDQLSALGMAADRVELEVLKGTLGMIPGIKLEITSPEAVLEEAGLEAA